MKARILLIEDNPGDVGIIKKVLQRYEDRCLLTHFGDGGEALEYLQRAEIFQPIPDLILLDINLPKVNGKHILMELKNHPLYNVIPVVMLTSSGRVQDREESLGLKAVDYIVKPFDIIEYQNAILNIWEKWIVKSFKFAALWQDEQFMAKKA